MKGNQQTTNAHKSTMKAHNLPQNHNKNENLEKETRRQGFQKLKSSMGNQQKSLELKQESILFTQMSLVVNIYVILRYLRGLVEILQMIL